jgi:hypothetical protein
VSWKRELARLLPRLQGCCCRNGPELSTDLEARACLVYLALAPPISRYCALSTPSFLPILLVNLFISFFLSLFVLPYSYQNFFFQNNLITLPTKRIAAPKSMILRKGRLLPSPPSPFFPAGPLSHVPRPYLRPPSVGGLPPVFCVCLDLNPLPILLSREGGPAAVLRGVCATRVLSAIRVFRGCVGN